MGKKMSLQEINCFIENVAKEKGVKFLSGYVDSKTPLRFLCTQCGQETKILWGQLQQGKNSNMICVDCSYKQRSKTQSLSYAELKAEVEAKGSILLTSSDVKLNTHTELSLICTRCGDQFIMPYISYKRGRNQNLKCSKCVRLITGEFQKKRLNRVSHNTNRQNTYQAIKDTVESRGAELLTTYDEYKDKDTRIRFKCSQCGKEHKIHWKKFENGQNPNLLCQDCLPQKLSYTTEMVREEFAKAGVELLNEYKNVEEPLLFNCKQCGALTSITWGRYHYLGRNPYFLCSSCLRGNYACDPNDVSGTYSENGMKRNKAESRSREFCKTFYNIKKGERSDYESHHVKRIK